MTTAALLGPYHADRVLAWENGHAITYSHFLSDVGALADLLPEKPTVINLADDRYRFLVGFALHWFEDRQRSFLLAARRVPWASLLETMPLAIVLSMTRNKSNSFAPIGFPKVDGIRPVRQRFPKFPLTTQLSWPLHQAVRAALILIPRPGAP
jgi:hypothetical protein